MTEDRDRQSDRPDRRRGGPIPRVLIGLFLWTVVFVLALRFFPAVQFVVLGLLAAGALAAALSPLADRIPGPAGLRAVSSVLAVLILVAAILFLVGWALKGPVSDLIADWPRLEEQINDLLSEIGSALGLEDPLSVRRLFRNVGHLLTGGRDNGVIAPVINVVTGILIALTVVIISTIYLLSFPNEKLMDPALGLLPPHRRKPTRRALCELAPELRWWVIGTLFSMSVIGLISGIGFWIVGLRMAAALGLLAGLAQMIPTFGPLLTLVAAMLVAALQGTYQLVGVVVIYVVLQTIESYILTPMVMRRAVKIPPVVTLFTVLVWGNIFGPAGLILAIPLDLLIWVMLKHHLAVSYADSDEQAPAGQEA